MAQRSVSLVLLDIGVLQALQLVMRVPLAQRLQIKAFRAKSAQLARRAARPQRFALPAFQAVGVEGVLSLVPRAALGPTVLVTHACYAPLGDGALLVCLHAWTAMLGRTATLDGAIVIIAARVSSA